MNYKGKVKRKGLLKLDHELFKSFRGREKEKYTGIGITLKFMDAAEFLSTIQKLDDVDWTSGVKLDRGGL